MNKSHYLNKYVKILNKKLTAVYITCYIIITSVISLLTKLNFKLVELYGT